MISRQLVTVVTAALAAVTTALLAGCTSAWDVAADEAAAAVRRQAQEVRDGVLYVLGGGGYDDGRRLEIRLRDAVTRADGAVFGLEIEQGDVRVDAAFTEQRGAGGWGTVDHVTARLCVRFTGVTGFPDRLTMSDVECAAEIPNDDDAPNVDVTVKIDN